MKIDEKNNLNILEQFIYFPTIVYSIKNNEFLKTVKKVSKEYLNITKKEIDLNQLYPVFQSRNFYEDARVKDFAIYVGQTAWNILQSQGLDVQNKATTFLEMWSQEHYKHSSMEQHVHGNGSQISGFYFLECPKDCSRLVIHDPRPGKTQINLPELNVNEITNSSAAINFIPEPGQLIFMNSWLPHSFSRHGSNKPIKFIHFNLSIVDNFIEPSESTDKTSNPIIV
jgi:uncharacterized protein (TIGR02466 family)